ncbi:DNA-directed RNA polymerase II subunit RPB2-like [Cornus florida]|uniref:DNA-directed RNA polymerase II subunit RPB2-like n=1 Tax=Cornus florida TaxID=4283 RepID=UPI00289BF84E|nr:DNA-directed RNA polymerase II subunit RPB2-like [Cornus florida]
MYIILCIVQSVDNGKDVNLQFAIKAKPITSGLKYSLAIGNRGQANAAGECAVSFLKCSPISIGVKSPNIWLHFVTLVKIEFSNRARRYFSFLCHCLFNDAVKGKLAKPRQLHNSQWGMMGPAETPEGQACGLVKNLALMLYITVGSAAYPILEFLEEWGTENFEVEYFDFGMCGCYNFNKLLSLVYNFPFNLVQNNFQKEGHFD